MTDAVAKPRWYHVTPDRFLIGLLVGVLLLLAADRLELLGLTRSSGWNVLLAAAVVCLGMLVGLIWFVASLLLKRRFQFGLKALMVLTAIVAIMCSWFAVKKRQSNRQKAAVQAIQLLDGQVIYDYEFDVNSRGRPRTLKYAATAWCRNLIGQDVLSQVFMVVVGRPQVTDTELVHLNELIDLKCLWLHSPQVTDAGLVHLKQLTNLEILWLKNTQVTDAGLVHLKELANLKTLYLSDAQVTDAGLVHLKQLGNLEGLLLDNTQVTDAGLVHLKELTNLLELNLNDTQVTDDGVDELQQALPNCEIVR